METYLSVATKIIDAFKLKGHKAYLVGGCVRDLILGREPKDFDIVTSALIEDILLILKTSFEKCHILDVGVAFSVAIVVIEINNEKFSFEIATMREERGYSDKRHPDEIKFTDSIEKDSNRRDFTINALYLDPATDKIFDFHGGQKDIKDKVICTVGLAKDRFEEDNLRKLRAIRFASQLEFKLSDEVKATNKKDPSLSVSNERVRDELIKILLAPWPGSAIKNMSNLGILNAVIPEFKKHEYIFNSIVFHLNKAANTEPTANNKLGLFMSILLSVFNPSTAEHIMVRLRFDSKLIKTVLHVIAHQSSLTFFDSLKDNEKIELMAQPWFEILYAFHSSSGYTFRNSEEYKLLEETYAKFIKTGGMPAPFINGKDILSAGVFEGRRIGVILSKIKELQLNGEITNRQEALIKMKELINS